MEPIYTEDYKGHKIEIYPDEYGESPRDWDNLGTMLCFHGRYSLGDKADVTSDDFNGWDEVRDYLKNKLHAVVVLPLYLYDHSGLSMSVGSFIGRAQHAEWDSGQVGFIYVTKEKLLQEFSKKRLSKKILERAEKVLQSEVQTYDDYLRGNVYGYKVLSEGAEEIEGEEIDSCWGFFGDYDDKENGALSEAKSTVDYRVKQEGTKC